LLIFTALRVDAGLPFLSKTVTWDEDVLLANGRVLSVHRTVTYAPDALGRSGRGGMKEQTMRFSHEGRRIEWENSNNFPIANLPDILDIANGMPILVMPVDRWGPCNKYGFPQEGLVAFGYKNDKWSRVAVHELPKELKVNLLRDTHAIQHWKEYQDKRITPAMKQRLEDRGWGWTKQGQSISEASRFLASSEDACTRIHPAPNPQLTAQKKENAEAELNAQTLAATVISTSTAPENISPDDFRRAKGKWTGTGYLSASCQETVERVEPLRQYADGGSWMLIGYTLALRNGSQIPVQPPAIKSARPYADLETVACDAQSIYAVGRQGNGQLIVHRFTQGGVISGASRIDFPGLLEFFPAGKRPMVWEVLAANGQLTITFSSYSYTQTASRGGVLERRISYAVRLPPNEIRDVAERDPGR
jgi:hypothetical protein